MDSAKKSFEIQAQIRQNAGEFKNALNDLYTWEKEIKEKERELKCRPAKEDYLKTLPVRSHALTADTEKLAKETQEKPESRKASKAVLKAQAEDERHNTANEHKDCGNQHVKLGSFEMAIDAYTKAINIYGDDPVFYTNRALCYLKLERYEDCIEDCEHAIDLDKMAVKAYYRRMQANESLGNNMDALKDCSSVLMIDPKNGDAKRSLERINAKLRRNVKTANGPSFSASRSDLVDILPYEKPPYKRSSKQMRRVPIVDVIGPKDTKNYENSTLQISDEDIDKLFNSNCGPFVEVKNKAGDILRSKPVVEKRNTELPKQSDSNKITPAAPRTAAVAIDSNRILASVSTNTLTSTARLLPPAPTSTAEFYLNWKELDSAQKYQYLKSISIPNLCKLLGAGFDSETLNGLLTTLRDNYLVPPDPGLPATLLEISKNGQVPILSLLMSSEENKVLADLIKAISCDSNAAIVEQIAKNFYFDI